MSQAKKSTLATLLLSTLCCPSAHAFIPATTRSINKIHHLHNTCSRNPQQKLGKIDNGFDNSSLDFSTKIARHPRTRMNMVATPSTTGAAAVMGVISGGILGGALHAIAGKF